MQVDGHCYRSAEFVMNRTRGRVRGRSCTRIRGRGRGGGRGSSKGCVVKPKEAKGGGKSRLRQTVFN